MCKIFVTTALRVALLPFCAVFIVSLYRSHTAHGQTVPCPSNLCYQATTLLKIPSWDGRCNHRCKRKMIRHQENSGIGLAARSILYGAGQHEQRHGAARRDVLHDNARRHFNYVYMEGPPKKYLESWPGIDFAETESNLSHEIFCLENDRLSWGKKNVAMTT